LGFVALFYVILILTGLVYVWVFRPAESERRLYRLMTIFPNVGFMGIPVISAVFGEESMIYIVLYMLGYNLILYTYGLALARKAAEDAGSVVSREQNQWKRMINPGTISSVAAVIIFLFGIPLPAPAVNFCDYMGNATIPLSMLLIGMSIAKADLKKIFSNGKIYAYTAVKMLLLPILIIAAFLTAWSERAFTKKKTCLCAISCVMLFCEFLLMRTAFIWVTEETLPFGIKGEHIGPFIRNILLVLMVCELVILIYSIINGRLKNTDNTYCAAISVTGVILSLSYMNLLRRLENVDRFLRLCSF